MVYLVSWEYGLLGIEGYGWWNLPSRHGAHLPMDLEKSPGSNITIGEREEHEVPRGCKMRLSGWLIYL